MGIYLVMKNNIKRSLQHKLLFLVTLCLPIILCVLAGSIHVGRSTLRLGILGMEALSEDVQKELNQLLDQSSGIRYEIAEEESWKTDLITGKYQAILDYSGSMSFKEFEYLSLKKETTAKKQEIMLREALRQNQMLQLGENNTKGLTSTEKSAAILISLFLLISTVHASRIIRDKQEGMLMRYHFACKSDNGYVLGYFAYNLLVTYLQVILCILVMNILNRQNAMSFAQISIISLSVTLLAATFAMLISHISRSEVQANITASAVAAVFSLLGGTFVSVESMPAALQVLSWISPVRWVVELVDVIA